MGNGSLGSMLDKMPSLDLVTIVILGFDAYIIYSQVDRFSREALFNLSTDPFALAFQASVVLAFIYTVEFLHDKKKESTAIR